MKKISLVLLFFFTLSVTPVLADEGMWLLPLIEKLNSKKMKELGFKLTAKDIYDINNSSLKDAVVHFGGGCTAEIISDEGLVLTNHHCGYGAIQKLSTVENDYLENGYWAMSRDKELPAGLSVTFLESFTDVTPQIEAAIAGITDPRAKMDAQNKAIKDLEEKAVAGNKYLAAKISSFFGGNAYYLVVSKTFNDVRFVGAPPSSIGKFGYDTDNWVWPRHTGDFSMFRVYADKDNNPASYSKDNVPYKPKKSLTISLKGVQQKDFSMVIGYPGRTYRYMTSFELDERTDISNAIRIHARGVRQDVLQADMLADPKVRLQYSSKFASSSNYWKNSIGMNQAVAKLKVKERRLEEEKQFTEWVNALPARVEKYGKALSMIKQAVEQRKEALYVSTYLNESINNIEVAAVASQYREVIPLIEKGDIAAAKAKAAELDGRIKGFMLNYNAPTDKKVAVAMLTVYKEKVKKEYLPAFYNIIENNFGGSIEAYVNDLFEKTVFTSFEKISEALNNSPEKLVNDPVNAIYKNIGPVAMPLQQLTMRSNALSNAGQKALLAGLLEMKQGKDMYPDANSTMRMTYGQVMNYSPKDAVIYDYVTTLDGVMEKADPNNWEFVVPAKLTELYKNKDYGQYAMPNGKLPVAFITTNDITGGNSGSPVLNAKGELIGTAFDGNWEAMSGDIVFEPQLQRCINVDIRYTLFIIDKFGGAGHLLKEMKIVK